MKSGFSFFKRKKKPLFNAEKDIFLVAYPKSGITWVRWLIANYLLDGRADFISTNQMIPDIHADPHLVKQLKSPRILKSHLSHTSVYQNVIYITRDVRDVVVSYYFFYLKYKYIPKETPFEVFFEQFLTGNVNYGLWEKHVLGWTESKAKNWLHIRYEDLTSNPNDELRRILQFLNMQIDEIRLARAVEASAFNRMQKLEIQQRDLIPRNAKSEPGMNFVRKGKVGDFQNYLGPEMEARLLEANSRGMRVLGYT